MITALHPDQALRQRIEARLDQRETVVHVRAPFDASVRQADAIGACQVVNRYRCHGPVVSGAVAIGRLFGRASVPALVAVFALAWVVMAVAA